MAIDPTFGMPFTNFQQTGSFVQPVEPPIDPWDGGSLVALPCVNVEWLRLLLGAGTQLLNPSTWDPALSDTARVLVLQRATDLLAGLAALDLCVNPVIGASLDNCVLNLHLADGSIVPVTNWASQFGDCVRANVPAPVPTPVNPGHPTDNACAIAEWLRSVITNDMLQKLHDALQAGQSVDQWITGVIDEITAFAPILGFITGPFLATHTTALPQPLADLQDAVNDTGFQRNLRCAIYAAIKAVGYVDGTNFAQVATNISGIVYTHAWVPPMIANFWTNMGLAQIQTLQNEGSLTAADCSSCALAFCKEFDVRLNTQGYTASGGLSPTWVSGLGWVGAYESGANVTRLWISQPTSYWGGLCTVDTVAVNYTQAGAGDGSNENHTPHINLFNGATLVKTINMPLGPWAGGKRVFAVSPPVAADSFDFYVLSEGHVSNPLLIYSEISGTTSGPFSGSTCPD